MCIGGLSNFPRYKHGNFNCATDQLPCNNMHSLAIVLGMHYVTDDLSGTRDKAMTHGASKQY